MKVELIAYTPNPDYVVAMSAKLCYSKVGVSDIREGLDDENVEKFISHLTSIGHESPVEHISFTFAIEGISRTCTHQLVRHRIASYSQQSQRYVKLNQFEYIIPPQIENNEKAKKIFIKSMIEDQKAYDEIVETLMEDNIKIYLNQGYDEKKAKSMAEKKSIEDARYVFPNACETKIVVTMNARTLLNFFEHRLCERAQWEIKEMAYLMLEQVKKVSPHIFRNSGPSCVSKSKCKEGDMSCRHPEIPKERITCINEKIKGEV
jgi:thymidylate synthase, flavin-dependent